MWLFQGEAGDIKRPNWRIYADLLLTTALEVLGTSKNEVLEEFDKTVAVKEEGYQA